MQNLRQKKSKYNDPEDKYGVGTMGYGGSSNLGGDPGVSPSNNSNYRSMELKEILIFAICILADIMDQIWMLL